MQASPEMGTIQVPITCQLDHTGTVSFLFVYVWMGWGLICLVDYDAIYCFTHCLHSTCMKNTHLQLASKPPLANLYNTFH